MRTSQDAAAPIEVVVPSVKHSLERQPPAWFGMCKIWEARARLRVFQSCNLPRFPGQVPLIFDGGFSSNTGSNGANHRSLDKSRRYLLKDAIKMTIVSVA